MPVNEAMRIRAKIVQYAQEPASLGNNIKALKESSYIRLRVGDWRVIMDDSNTVLAVIAVGAHGGIYG